MPLPRVSRSHHLVDAEGIQLRKNPQYEEGKHSLPFSPSANLQKLYYAPARCRFRFHSFFFRFARTVTISFSHRFCLFLSLSLAFSHLPHASHSLLSLYVNFLSLLRCPLHSHACDRTRRYSSTVDICTVYTAHTLNSAGKKYYKCSLFTCASGGGGPAATTEGQQVPSSS